tara:strand:+ start:59 stop:496 length:438 start_codon:yes stop_codon:yes gene_type:complete
MKKCKIIILILLGIFINGTPLLSQITYSGKGEVVAVRFLELKDTVNVEDFEKFVIEEFNSTFEGAIPGLKQYISKSDRGIAVDSYAMFMIFDSQVVRNIMIPNEKSAEWMDAIMEKKNLWSLWGKLGTYVTDESLSNFNDFVELR